MSTTKAAILSFVNDVLRRNDTNVDEQIQSVLDDLSDLHVLTGLNESQSFDNTTFSLAYPADALQTEEAILTVTLTVNGYRSRPLSVIPGGYREYLRWCSGNLAAIRSVVHSICCRPPAIWLYPPPSESGWASINYYKRHAAIAGEAGTIEFSDQWTNCLKWGTAAKVAAKYGLNGYTAAAFWETEYQKEKFKQKILSPKDTAVGR